MAQQNIQIKYCNYFFETYKKNIHSQNGEDGVIEEILKRLDINKGFVCEVGIVDIEKYSNTFNLIKKEFNALLIENNVIRNNEITKATKNFKNVKVINDDVNANITLDTILQKSNVPKDLDIISIDNSGNEYNIWKSLQTYKPKLVIIKINSGVNPTIKDHIHTKNKYDGTAFLPMYNLGNEKGYTFVLHSGNMIFVRNDLYERLHITYTNPLENFFPKWYLEEEQNKNKNSFVLNNSQAPFTDIKEEKKKTNTNNPLINRVNAIF